MIVRCKQPIKIEKPLQCLWAFSYCVDERNILQSVLLSFVFSVFIFSVLSKFIIVIHFMFLGINMSWALLRAHFNPRQTARAKMSLSRAQNIFMPANINSIVLFQLFPGISRQLQMCTYICNSSCLQVFPFHQDTRI